MQLFLTALCISCFFIFTHKFLGNLCMGLQIFSHINFKYMLTFGRFLCVTGERLFALELVKNKKKQQALMESLLLSPTSANQYLLPSLTAVSASPRKMIFSYPNLELPG